MIKPVKEFFSSFFLSFYSRDFYRLLIDAPLSKGIGYLCFLALTAMLFGAVLLVFQGKPRLESFLMWVEHEVPTFTLSAEEGMKLQSGVSRKEVIHPEYGPIALFDSAKTEADLNELQKFPIVFTSENIYLWSGFNKETKVVELNSFKEFKDEPNRKFLMDGKSIYQFYEVYKVFLLFWATAAILVLVLIWKFLAAIFYSWFGLIYNFFRFPRLSYSTVLNLSIFTLTPVFTFQLLQLSVPFLGKIPFGFFGAFLVTTSYLAFAIKGTEDTAERIEEGN